MASEKDKEREAQAWLAFASAAIAGYNPDEEIDSFEDLIDDMVDVSTHVADSMVEEFNSRFSIGNKRSPAAARRGRRKRSRASDEEQ